MYVYIYIYIYISILKFPFGVGDFGVLGAPGALRKHRYLPLRSHFEASNIRYLPLRMPSGLRVPSENIGIYRSGATSRLRKYSIYRSGGLRGSGYPPKTSGFTAPEPLRGFRNTLFTAPEAFGTLGTFRKHRYLPLQSHFEVSKIKYLPLLWLSGLWIPSTNIGVYHSAATTTLRKYTIYRSGAI